MGLKYLSRIFIVIFGILIVNEISLISLVNWCIDKILICERYDLRGVIMSFLVLLVERMNLVRIFWVYVFKMFISFFVFLLIVLMGGILLKVIVSDGVRCRKLSIMWRIFVDEIFVRGLGLLLLMFSKR